MLLLDLRFLSFILPPFDNPIAQVKIVSSEIPIKSIEIQLVRVETCGLLCALTVCLCSIHSLLPIRLPGGILQGSYVVYLLVFSCFYSFHHRLAAETEIQNIQVRCALPFFSFLFQTVLADWRWRRHQEPGHPHLHGFPAPVHMPVCTDGHLQDWCDCWHLFMCLFVSHL